MSHSESCLAFVYFCSVVQLFNLFALWSLLLSSERELSCCVRSPLCVLFLYWTAVVVVECWRQGEIPRFCGHQVTLARDYDPQSPNPGRFDKFSDSQFLVGTGGLWCGLACAGPSTPLRVCQAAGSFLLHTHIECRILPADTHTPSTYTHIHKQTYTCHWYCVSDWLPALFCSSHTHKYTGYIAPYRVYMDKHDNTCKQTSKRLVCVC